MNLSPQTAPVFALVDCNNFYASCEKLFRPDLQKTPVVVLSNNDGCVVARSREAKALGIKMAVPFHTLQQAVRQHGIVAFSSNYALYADISQRVMSTLETLAPRVEIYSIDEAFVDLSGVDRCMSLMEMGQQLRQTVYQWVGIQVGVGIAPTKTLAKLANHAAKESMYNTPPVFPVYVVMLTLEWLKRNGGVAGAEKRNAATVTTRLP